MSAVLKIYNVIFVYKYSVRLWRRGIVDRQIYAKRETILEEAKLFSIDFNKGEATGKMMEHQFRWQVYSYIAILGSWQTIPRMFVDVNRDQHDRQIKTNGSCREKKIRKRVIPAIDAIQDLSVSRRSRSPQLSYIKRKIYFPRYI